MRIKGAGFYITHGKGFHIVFENGYTVSVQFGPGSYSDYHDASFDNKNEVECGKMGSTEAETAVWGPDGNLIALHGDSDTVQGYRTPAQVLDLLNWAAKQGGV